MSTGKIEKYVSVFNIGLQNTFVYRWNYFLRALFGLIPLKLHAFHQGVNVTLGLPFPRTSPDHGTAFEIAGKGIARPDSMIAAIDLAVELTGRSS